MPYFILNMYCFVWIKIQNGGLIQINNMFSFVAQNFHIDYKYKENEEDYIYGSPLCSIGSNHS